MKNFLNSLNKQWQEDENELLNEIEELKKEANDLDNEIKELDEKIKAEDEGIEDISEENSKEEAIGASKESVNEEIQKPKRNWFMRIFSRSKENLSKSTESLAKLPENLSHRKEKLLQKKVTNMIKTQDYLRKENLYLKDKNKYLDDVTASSKQAVKTLDENNREILEATKKINSEKIVNLQQENNTLSFSNQRLERKNRVFARKIEVLKAEQRNLTSRLKSKQQEKEKDTDYQK